MKQENTNRQRRKGGRPAKSDPVTECVMVRFNASEYARFLALLEQSGVKAKAVFIKARVFGQPFRVVKTDRAALEYVAKLTTFYAQFRGIGTNYNQVVKELHSNFSHKKALALLYKLEKLTTGLAVTGQQIIALSKEFEEKYLQK
ncbi:MAG: conjugal transfer protein MobA [Mariniphaga sp.]|nr:conjugal transfer protein MobA [Mariniphaga sp.]